MSDREKSCEERIAKHLASRREDFEAMFTRLERASAVGNDEKYEEALEHLDEYPLGSTSYTVWRIDLSTGGPGDWLEVHVDDDRDVRRVEYHFNDWFDHASVALSGDEADVFERFARHVTADFYTES
jgi:hypothetical protein